MHKAVITLTDGAVLEFESERHWFVHPVGDWVVIEQGGYDAANDLVLPSRRIVQIEITSTKETTTS